MVDLQTARSINSKLVQRQAITAVFTGGTSGIGEYTIRALAAQHGTTGRGLRVYLVGRNENNANKIITDCSQVCPKGELIFVKAVDLSLLNDVDRTCEKLMTMEREKTGSVTAKIDILVMSHADLHFGLRRETKEGLDKTMAFLYYSRMRFITKLLPLLQASPLPAHVVSIFGAGLEKGLPKWRPEDISLCHEDKYSMASCRTHVTVMTTLFFEELAKQSSGKLSLVHEFPGLVMTPAFKDPSHPWWFKLIWALISPVIHLFRPVISADETGERVLFLCSDRYPAQVSSPDDSYSTTQDGVAIATSTTGVRGGGAYSVKHTGETNDIEETYVPLRKDGFAEWIWKHTNEAFDIIESGKRFDA